METKREIIMRQIGAKICVSEKDSRLQPGAALPETSSGQDRAVPGRTGQVQPEYLPQYAAGYCRGSGRAGVGVRIFHAGGAGPLERLRPPGYGGDGGRRDEIRPPPARKESGLSPLS